MLTTVYILIVTIVIYSHRSGMEFSPGSGIPKFHLAWTENPSIWPIPVRYGPGSGIPKLGLFPGPRIPKITFPSPGVPVDYWLFAMYTGEESKILIESFSSFNLLYCFL